ncbi:hypothetical protein F442_11123 [Phytophthora nicotianae P10297]|uniref:Uncharacterized protein n=1 Tax=Phytophthora nicotianae P10297 TaxID=1317064 RepID=W2Z6R0_PHYNI|nr:hypothetical protein F442_11123 [Phytophthora nicotianae P10297]
MTNLTDCQRCCIIDELLKLSIDGDLPHGAKIAVARDFKRSPSAIGKIWTHYCISVTAEVEGGEWQSRIKENPGTKRKDRSKCIVRLQELPIEDRSVERRAAGVEHVLIFINDDTLEFEPLTMVGRWVVHPSAVPAFQLTGT